MEFPRPPAPGRRGGDWWGWVNAKTVSIASFVAVALFVVLIRGQAKSSTPPMLPSPVPGALYFLSLGDFGTGSKEQVQVAHQMARVAAHYNTTFVLGLGDNFYDSGLEDLDDPQIKDKFEEMYGSYPTLRRMPWYMALGDHDHRLNVTAQVLYSQVNPMWQMPAQYFSVRHKMDDGSVVHIVVTDSIPLESLWADGLERRWGDEFREPTSGAAVGEAQLYWLESELSSSDADWLIVTGHRPVLSGARRSREPAELRYMERLMEVLRKHQVDIYMNGHDHTAQDIRRRGMRVLVNGLGGYGVHQVDNVQGTVWKSAEFNGFAVHRVTKSEMAVTWVDTEGRPRHTAHVPHNLARTRKRAGKHMAMGGRRP